MTDADFFRRCVAERADSDTTKPHMFFIRAAIRDEINDILLESPADQTEILVLIAALCERAAVDLTIPNSRVKKKGARK